MRKEEREEQQRDCIRRPGGRGRKKCRNEMVIWEEDKMEIFWGNTVHEKVLEAVLKFIKKATRRRKRFLREKAPVFKTVRWRLKL